MSPQPKEAIDPTTAYLVTSLLKSVVKEGTGRGAQVARKAACGQDRHDEQLCGRLVHGLCAEHRDRRVGRV